MRTRHKRSGSASALLPSVVWLGGQAILEEHQWLLGGEPGVLEGPREYALGDGEIGRTALVKGGDESILDAFWCSAELLSSCFGDDQ